MLIFRRLFLLLTLFLMFAEPAVSLESSDNPPEVQNGYLDLRTWDFSARGLNLDGEWLFAPGVFAGPDDSAEFAGTPVPAVWDLDGGVRGFGTYKLNLLFPETPQALAVKLGYIAWAYRIFINGEERLTVGRPSQDLSGETMQAWLGTIDFTASGRVEILVQVSNFQARKGGLINSIYLGSSAELQRKRERSLITLFFALGIAVYIGIYYVAFFFFRKQERYALHFGLFSLLLAARAFMLEIDGFKDTFPALQRWSFELIAKLDYFTNFPLLLGFTGFFFLYLKIPKKEQLYLRVTRVVTLLYIALVLFFPYRIYNRFLIVFQIYIIVSIVLLFLVMLRQMRRSGQLKPFFIFSYSLLCLCSLIDILTNLTIVKTETFVTFYTGFFAFVVLQSVSINRTFTMAMTRVEKLTGQLNILLHERERAQLVLEEKVIERTKTLEEATREAKEANRAKSDFLARMSHEIRTPLNAVLGFGQILQMGPEAPEVSGYSRLIVDESEKLLMLINQLLDLSKIDAGEMILEARPFRLREELDSILALFEPQMAQKGLKFWTDLPLDEYLLTGDPIKFRQILINLLGNAVKFTEKGSVGLQVYPVRESAESAEFLFSIIDTGIGIAPDKQLEIFNAFVQVDSSIARRYGGTGLGTAIARSLVELMGGALFLESSESGGSAFWFRLAFPAAVEEGAPAGGDTAVQMETGNLGLKVLVVEDYPANQMVIRKYLELAGCSTVLASDGPSGIAAFREQRPDMVFLDLHLPGMDGCEVAVKIRSLVSGADIPVFGLTADAFEETIQRCLDAGMDDVLAKPLRLKEFHNLLLRGMTLIQQRSVSAD